jgi:hypothetical protein
MNKTCNNITIRNFLVDLVNTRIKFKVEMKRNGISEVCARNHGLVLVVRLEIHTNVKFRIVWDLVHNTSVPEKSCFTNYHQYNQIARL